MMCSDASCLWDPGDNVGEHRENLPGRTGLFQVFLLMSSQVFPWVGGPMTRKQHLSPNNSQLAFLADTYTIHLSTLITHTHACP